MKHVVHFAPGRPRRDHQDIVSARPQRGRERTDVPLHPTGAIDVIGTDLNDFHSINRPPGAYPCTTLIRAAPISSLAVVPSGRHRYDPDNPGASAFRNARRYHQS
jgi:hypothetical protein